MEIKKSILMWMKNKQTISAGNESLNIQAGRDVNLIQADFPTEIVDEKINNQLDTILKSRFFSDFNLVSEIGIFGRLLVEGNLSRGSDRKRGLALAWCARLLARSDVGQAEKYLILAKGLANDPEVEIADALIKFQKGDEKIAQKILSELDSPDSRATTFNIMLQRDGAEKGIQWLKSAGIEAIDLNSAGRFFLLLHYLELSQWDFAKGFLTTLSDDDFLQVPALNHLVAMTQLLSTVPNELRVSVLHQFPFQSGKLQLASNASSIEARKLAQDYFTKAAVVARQLDCLPVAEVEEQYALWLELKDPESTSKGKQRLETKLRDAKSALYLVPLGLQFGIKLDLIAVEDEIDRKAALSGGITLDAANARLAIAFMQKTSGEAAVYIARYSDDLSECLGKKSMQFLQIELLSEAGLPGKAKEILEELIEEGIKDIDEGRLRSIIAEAEGVDTVEVRKSQFIKSHSLIDLELLVDELNDKHDWSELCVYGLALFERTRSLQDAEHYVNALINANRSDELIKFIKNNLDILGQSKNLQMLFAWALYNEGELLEARAELEKLSDNRETQNYRALEVNLAVALGDWSSLSIYVSNEYLEREKRTAKDLITSAQLAFYIDSLHAKNLMFAAVEKGSDPAILVTAYFLALRAGLEGNADVGQWLNRAIELSEGDSLIQKMTLKEVIERKPEWDRKESEVRQMLYSGHIPMFLAAESLNKSLMDLMIYAALTNQRESDARRRIAIPAYSGTQSSIQLNTNMVTVGMDATALLTLSSLNLLDKALDFFEVVNIPHSTLTWLFEEKQKAAFHQPSRIRNAHLVRDLLAREVLKKFVPSTVVDDNLSVQVGDELAQLIAEAGKAIEESDTQRIVVRPSPVHRLSSFMEEEVDLSSYAPMMSSCRSIVDKLKAKGHITAVEERNANSYLQLNEKPWPSQPDIIDGAILYLDDLAVTYFLHLGILEKLHTVGFQVIVSPEKILETNALIAYEGISEMVNVAIASICAAVNSRIENGKIKVGRRHQSDKEEDQIVSQHPTVGVINLASDCDAIISDDRFLNQRDYVDDGNSQSPVFSTLDLLDLMASGDSISTDELMEYRTVLRRSGYIFVTVTEDELEKYLKASAVNDGELTEVVELRAIRENILQVRMSDWLQLPQEAPWLNVLFLRFIRVLRTLWSDGVNFSEARIRSNWIADQIDVRGWAHCFGADNRDNIVGIGRGQSILLLLVLLSDAPQEIREAYWSWLEDRILVPIKDQFPDLYDWIVEQMKIRAKELAETELAEIEMT